MALQFIMVPSIHSHEVLWVFASNGVRAMTFERCVAVHVHELNIVPSEGVIADNTLRSEGEGLFSAITPKYVL